VTEVRWTEQAANDLAAILEFIRRDSPAYARLVVGRLYDAIGKLRDFPDLGRVVPEREQPTLRELILPPYRVVYRRATDLVEILTIFHSARLLPETISGDAG
jgi:plasmid stabilization system protein ParE